MEKIIELKDISKSYGENSVLKGFSDIFSTGEMVALVGKSGSGKSTLLNIIGLLENSDSGEIIYKGQSIDNIDSKQAMRIRRYGLGYVFQNFALVENETVLENLKLALEYRKGVNKTNLIEEALNSFGLKDYVNHKVYQLSGGQQQRIAMARVELKPCEVILADEPTASLDRENGTIVIETLKRYRNQGKLVVIATHDMDIAKECDRIIRLD
ncbi:putative ABC transport system ATP-binding protein [Peptoniphilus asaccharolyticus DSM 20463]|uniref:Putative ABC transport system ATP-binding protein n=1 Tax=Peptoniphilus asaccharolyticus DSM 20463 TaxID=573058 RepID=A0A1W1UI11_PEPAS|nr:putative bacteriocin export ABC transporter [Peptoniphilus asaccharolyticus]MBL7574749.1 putative bacteriocin export ABC transporter [Peptoniphilus asaccharolyticus]SMB80707.1 putative ABC transport system ATP-binding protein [Peptoniphilus asaccharolyticus DSM 20463]